MQTPRQIAAQIMVRPGPNGGHYFNGLDDLDATVARIEPGSSSLDPRVRRVLLDLVRHELGLGRRRFSAPALEIQAA